MQVCFRILKYLFQISCPFGHNSKNRWVFCAELFILYFLTVKDFNKWGDFLSQSIGFLHFHLGNSIFSYLPEFIYLGFYFTIQNLSLFVLIIEYLVKFLANFFLNFSFLLSCLVFMAFIFLVHIIHNLMKSFLLRKPK